MKWRTLIAGEITEMGAAAGFLNEHLRDLDSEERRRECDLISCVTLKKHQKHHRRRRRGKHLRIVKLSSVMR